MPSTVGLCFACLALGIACGCSSIPRGQSVVDAVSVRGTHAISGSEVEDKLSTEASPKFLGLFRGLVYDYEVFNQTTLQRDLARVERFYRARGYYSAHARAGRVTTPSRGHVKVEIVVEEGPPTLNDRLTIHGIDALPAPVQTAIRVAARVALPKGAPFEEEQGTQCVTSARKALTDLGYAYASVERDTYIDIVEHAANTSLTVVSGETARFGKILIEGLDPDGAGPRPQEIPEAPLRRAIDIEEGEPFSTAEIDAATQALLDLEVFAAVTAVPDLSNPETRVVPLHIRVEPSRLRQVRLGGGVQFDGIKTEIHGLSGWENHNFLGALRDFSIDFTPGVVLYPTRVDNLVAPESLFPEEKLRVQLKQPGFIEARTEAFARPEVNVFPLLVQTDPTTSDPVVGYVELKGAIGLERTFWKKLYVNLSYDAQIEKPFAYKGPLDPDLSTLVILYPELLTKLDFRDSAQHPHAGVYIANDLQIASGFLGGETHDIKIEPEVRTYVPLAHGVTFATRAAVGFLFPSNYGYVVQNQLNDPVTPENRADRVRDIETVLFRGLFSGGPTSNRGFAIRGVSPHGVVPFLNPTTALQQSIAGCIPDSNGNTLAGPAACSVPIGGFTLWELSNEVRFEIQSPLSGATFCDMGDVSPHELGQAQAFRLGHMHLSCGVGARYDTPVGPIRLDIGYRIQPLQVLGYPNESAAYQADPSNGYQSKPLGVPIAIAIGIGEAF